MKKIKTGDKLRIKSTGEIGIVSRCWESLILDGYFFFVLKNKAGEIIIDEEEDFPYFGSKEIELVNEQTDEKHSKMKELSAWDLFLISLGGPEPVDTKDYSTPPMPQGIAEYEAKLKAKFAKFTKEQADNKKAFLESVPFPEEELTDDQKHAYYHEQQIQIENMEYPHHWGI